MMVSNRNLLFQGSIFRFHVCFGGCNYRKSDSSDALRLEGIVNLGGPKKGPKKISGCLGVPNLEILYKLPRCFGGIFFFPQAKSPKF